MTTTARLEFKKALFEKVSNDPDFMEFTGGGGSESTISCFAEEQGFIPDHDEQWKTHPHRAFYKITTDEPLETQQKNLPASSITFRIIILSHNTSSFYCEELDAIIRNVVDDKNLSLKSTQDNNQDICVWYSRFTNLVSLSKQSDTNYWQLVSQYEAKAKLL